MLDFLNQAFHLWLNPWAIVALTILYLPVCVLVRARYISIYLVCLALWPVVLLPLIGVACYAVWWMICLTRHQAALNRGIKRKPPVIETQILPPDPWMKRSLERKR